MPGSFFLKKLKADTHKTLITILVGNNLVNITASAMTALLVANAFDSNAVGIATGILTLLVLIFGEILPKSLATNNSQRIALLVSPPLYVFRVLLTPIIFVLDVLVNIMFALIGKKAIKSVTDEELVAMATIGAEEGAIDIHEKEFIENVLEFTDIKVEEIMTPRVHVDAMPEDYSLKEASDFIINHTHTRIPVYRETIDNVVGLVHLKELFKSLHDGEEKKKSLRQIELHSPLKVSHSMQIHDLFLLFQKQRQHMAIVIDEYGGVAGLITMEDLIEEIVGDIEDESDQEGEWIKKINEIEYEVSGRIQLEEVEEITGVEFEIPGHKTISFFISDQLGRLPKKGDKVEFGGWEFEVTQMWRHSILKVVARKSS